MEVYKFEKHYNRQSTLFLVPRFHQVTAARALRILSIIL
jgi:hypothetical protein